MGVMVVSGASVLCTFGTTPATLNSASKIMGCSKPIITIKDTSAVNIATFGMCTSMLNPQVASATAAALGVLTPQPCVLAAVGTWTVINSNILVGGTPCLTNESQLICANGGTISVLSPGQTTLIT